MEGTGVENILVENEIFGPVLVKSAISDGDYIRRKHAMSIFADVLERLQFQIFLESLEQSRQIGTSVKKIQDVFQKGGNIEQRERERMRETNFSLWRMQMFPAFRERGRNCSEQFLYWNKFLTQIFPVIHNSTCSHREGNWERHLSATFSNTSSLAFVFCIK